MMQGEILTRWTHLLIHHGTISVILNPQIDSDPFDKKLAERNGCQLICTLAVLNMQQCICFMRDSFINFYAILVIQIQMNRFRILYIKAQLQIKALRCLSQKEML